jgi:hypothetical protein
MIPLIGVLSKVWSHYILCLSFFALHSLECKVKQWHSLEPMWFQLPNSFWVSLIHFKIEMWWLNGWNKSADGLRLTGWTFHFVKGLENMINHSSDVITLFYSWFSVLEEIFLADTHLMVDRRGVCWFTFLCRLVQ